jgi:hypothetical protein
MGDLAPARRPYERAQQLLQINDGNVSFPPKSERRHRLKPSMSWIIFITIPVLAVAFLSGRSTAKYAAVDGLGLLPKK